MGFLWGLAIGMVAMAAYYEILGRWPPDRPAGY